MKTLFTIPFVATVLIGFSACDAKVETGGPTVEKKETTVVNPPAEKKVENNTTVINPPSGEKK